MKKRHYFYNSCRGERKNSGAREESLQNPDIIEYEAELDEENVYINIMGTIGQDTYDFVAPILLDLITKRSEAKVILLIDSIGGAVYPTVKLVNLLRAMDNKIITVAFNNCASCACMLFSVGEERLMLSGTEYMMHKLASSLNGTEGFLNSKEYIQFSDDLKKLEARYKEIICYTAKSSISRKMDKIFNTDDDTFFTEDEVLKYGLATKIFHKFSEIDI